LKFYGDLSGLNGLAENLRDMAIAAGCEALVVGPALVLGLLQRPAVPYGIRSRKYRLPLAVAMGLAALAVLFWQSDNIVWAGTTLPLPALMALLSAAALSLLIRQRRRGELDRRTVLALVFAVFAGGLMLKILFNAQFRLYGFVLVVPATMLAIVMLLTWIPRYIERRGGDGWAIRAAVMAGLIVWSDYNLRECNYYLSARTEPVVAGQERVYATEFHGQVVNTMLAQMQRVPPEATVAVMPEGVMLNYLMRRINPTPYTNLMPPEMIMFGEENILRAYQDHPPDYIILAHKSTSEYGVPFFGKDYGQRLFGWVIQNYHAQGPPIGNMPLQDEMRFGMILLQRNATGQ
jgi:hypothetical protein